MRKQDAPSHRLPSFGRYLNKVFDFRSSVAGLTDARHDPDISPAAVFLATFHAFVFRLPSFQQLEAELTQPALQRWIGAERAFSDDTLRYSLSGFHPEGLERMLTDINRTLKRNKVFDADRVQGRIVAALDGIEVLSSYSRHCDSCLERRVTVRKAGVKVEQLQYYHRAVGSDYQRSGQDLPRSRMAPARRGRGYCRFAPAPPSPRPVRQPFFRHPSAGRSLRAGTGVSTGRGTWLGPGRES